MVSRPMSAPRARPAPGTSQARPPPPLQAPRRYDEDIDAPANFDPGDDDEEEEDEEIDLDSYEAYLAEIQRKAETRPHSARTLRPYPSESPEFYMVTTANPVTPLDLSATQSHLHTAPQPPTGKQQASQRVPTRPASARPRLNSGEDTRQAVPVVPRAPQTARPSSASSSGGRGGGGGGLRRKRQAPVANGSGEPLSTHIRAAYSDIDGRGRGRGGAVARVGGAASASHTASTVIQSRLRVFQEAELQHEYHRVVDVVTDLRMVVQHEQTQRMKAMARVRRLEEIVSLKDKKIDALLHGQCLGVHASGHTTSGSTDAAAAAQREMAQRERQHHAMMQKLRHKLAQQTQLVVTYEDAMQALRASLKSTHLMEMEQALEQLQLENDALNEALVARSEDMQLYEQHVAELKAADAHVRAQLAKSHQELKRSDHERHKLEHEVLFLKATGEQLEHKLALEQKKRAYDHAIAAGRSDRKSPVGKSPRVAASSPSPATSVVYSSRVSVEDNTSKESVAEMLEEIRAMRAPLSVSPPATKPLSVQRRRPTPLPACKQPPSPASSEDEISSGEREFEDSITTAPLDREEGSQVPGVLRKPETPREGGRKHVRWSGEDEDEKEEEGTRDDSGERIVKAVEGHEEGETSGAAAPEGRDDTGALVHANDEVLGVSAVEGSHEKSENIVLRGESDQRRSDVQLAIDARQELEKAQPLSASENMETEHDRSHDAENEATMVDEEPSDSGSSSDARIDSETTSDATLSRSSSTDSSRTSEGLGGPPSSSGSSSLSSLIAREDAAIMVADTAASGERASSDVDKSESPTASSPDRELAYDSDFSDNESV